MTDKATIPMSTVLEQANDIVKARGAVYGSPREDFTRTAKLWSAILGIDITPEQYALCMMAVKISRLVQTPGHPDSILDVAGYAWCYDECFLTGEMKDDRQIELDLKKPEVGQAETSLVYERHKCGYCGSEDHVEEQCLRRNASSPPY